MLEGKQEDLFSMILLIYFKRLLTSASVYAMDTNQVKIFLLKKKKE